jgi:hypothetical protein
VVGKGSTGERESNISPFAGVGTRPEAAPVATPVQSSDVERFCSIAADHYARAVCNVD